MQHAILVTNDDGIHAPGLRCWSASRKTLSDDVYVVAPETDQSGVAHRCRSTIRCACAKSPPAHFAVKGTPTDCVIMGVRSLMLDNPPDLILSGVNRGQNVAEDVTYSGTIAGAMEGTLLGVPSIALSQAIRRDAARIWDCAETPRPGLIRKILARRTAAGRPGEPEFPRLSESCR